MQTALQRYQQLHHGNLRRPALFVPRSGLIYAASRFNATEKSGQSGCDGSGGSRTRGSGDEPPEESHGGMHAVRTVFCFSQTCIFYFLVLLALRLPACYHPPKPCDWSNGRSIHARGRADFDWLVQQYIKIILEGIRFVVGSSKFPHACSKINTWKYV